MMKTLRITAIAALLATPLFPALAQEQRALGAHEHGVGTLDIAIEGGRIEIALRAPGADIVGFEHAAASEADRAAVTAALAKLEDPLQLFALPEAAGCSVVSAHAELESDAFEHEDEHDEDHGHENEDAHDDHGHDDHAEEHDDHIAGHSEFHAEYALDCTAPAALSQIGFGYFEAFPNALELELQLLSDQGAQAIEITREAPVLDLAGRL
ncbi:zinc uptake protein ZrgA [Salipiger bermudensis]|uniref:zinc uptake protein ZrgA n=1 Tax=Salipiger bermudensis TaxID=344736 RepID=UPI0028F71C76|nr:DUF2796 domain-containing protein [Salipiger bermudensis]